jgi:hypothetical protein
MGLLTRVLVLFNKIWMNQVDAAFCHGQFLLFIQVNVTVMFIHPGIDETTLEKLTVARGKNGLFLTSLKSVISSQFSD